MPKMLLSLNNSRPRHDDLTTAMEATTWIEDEMDLGENIVVSAPKPFINSGLVPGGLTARCSNTGPFGISGLDRATTHINFTLEKPGGVCSMKKSTPHQLNGRGHDD